MYRNHVKSATGWIIILSHVGLIITAFVTLQGKLDADRILQVVLTLAPITAAYFVSVVKGFITDQLDRSPGPLVNLNFAIISLLLPICLCGFILYLFLGYPNNIVTNVDSLQIWTSASEIVLGGAVGLIISDLFPTSQGNTVTGDVATDSAVSPDAIAAGSDSAKT